MQSKCKNSETERGYNNTFLSPSHKLSAFNDSTLRNNSPETSLLTTPKKVNKCDGIDDKITTIIEKTNKQVYKLPELSLIKEKNTVSDAERSIETNFDDETSIRKLEMFGESCKLNDQSPIVTIVDNNKLFFTKIAKRELEKQLSEEHFVEIKKIDGTDHKLKRPKTIKHSYSLDLGGVSNEGKIRKFSIETKLESLVAPKNFLGTVVSKFFDQSNKEDNVKSYLCEKDNGNADN